MKTCERHGQPLTACQACIDEIFAREGMRRAGLLDVEVAFKREYAIYLEEVEIHVDHANRLVTIKPLLPAPN